MATALLLNAEPLGCQLPPMYPGLSDADFVVLRAYKAQHEDMIAVRDWVTKAELVRLGFVKWLWESGRVTP